MTNLTVFESENSGTMSDDEVVASDAPPRYLFRIDMFLILLASFSAD